MGSRCVLDCESNASCCLFSLRLWSWTYMKDYFSSRRGEERVLLDFWVTPTFLGF
jgi:hypothetical protein